MRKDSSFRLDREIKRMVALIDDVDYRIFFKNLMIDTSVEESAKKNTKFDKKKELVSSNED